MIFKEIGNRENVEVICLYLITIFASTGMPISIFSKIVLCFFEISVSLHFPPTLTALTFANSTSISSIEFLSSNSAFLAFAAVQTSESMI